MASQVDICNAALIKVGISIPITQMAEQTKDARTLNRAWGACLDQVLERHAWPWAVAAQALALQEQDPFPGWTYRYEQPNDCVLALAVCPDTGIRLAQEAVVSAWAQGRQEMLARTGLMNFDTAHGEQGTSIVADLPGAYLIYVKRVTDTGRFPSLFAEALACRLAMEVAPTAGDLGIKMKSTLREDFEYALSMAIAAGYNASRDTTQALTPGMAARL